MDVDLLFKIAGIGILIAVLHQVLTKAGRKQKGEGRILCKILPQ